jgi:hypothetical protein
MYEEYLRIPWPDYQELMDSHSEEWGTEVGFVSNSDVLIPKKWVIDEQERKEAEDHDVKIEQIIK